MRRTRRETLNPAPLVHVSHFLFVRFVTCAGHGAVHLGPVRFFGEMGLEFFGHLSGLKAIRMPNLEGRKSVRCSWRRESDERSCRKGQRHFEQLRLVAGLFSMAGIGVSFCFAHGRVPFAPGFRVTQIFFRTLGPLRGATCTSARGECESLVQAPLRFNTRMVRRVSCML